MTVIIDYGVGNLFSLRSSLASLSVEATVITEPEGLKGASHVIFPGVGAFGDAYGKLAERGFVDALKDTAKAGTPILGICLGMQLLFEESEEFGLHKGLGLLPGRVVPLRDDIADTRVKVPHMGWNALDFDDDAPAKNPMLRAVSRGEHFYYVHSFYVRKSACTDAWSEYGGALVSGAVSAGNVYGTQFHPEKSGGAGLNMLRAFLGIG